MTEKSILFNEDELEPPSWLNEKFFTDVLKDAEKSEKIELANLKLSPATAKGDHYASVMFRALVHYRLNGKNKQKSMILKTMPETEGYKKDFLEGSHIFETEIGNYTKIIPKLESILRDADDNTILGPPVIYHALSPKKVIILEDISPMGYGVLRGRNPTLEEAKAAYTKIAKWHAASYKLCLEQPQLFDKFRFGIFNEPSLRNAPVFNQGISNFIELLDEHADLVKYKEYFEPLEHIVTTLCENSFSEYRKNPLKTAIYGLCHGDLHFKNMMFKHDRTTGKCEDVMLLDFQVSYVGPIVNDIIYSKFLILSSEQRANHWDEMLYHYITTFQETLRRINFVGKIPTIMNFRKELVRQRTYELFMLVTVEPLWESFTEATVDANDLLNDDDVRKKLYRNQKYVNQVRDCLPKYLYKGYLERKI